MTRTPSPILRLPAGVELQIDVAEVVVATAPPETLAELRNLVLGLRRPDRGSVTIDGVDPSRRANAALQRLGVVPARPDAPQGLRPRELYAFLAPHYPNWDEDLVEDLVERWAIADEPFRSLWRTQATEALWVAALAFHPRLVLLEEPFSLARAGLGARLADTTELLQEQDGALLITAATPPDPLPEGARLVPLRASEVPGVS